jgi:hypothetical protein
VGSGGAKASEGKRTESITGEVAKVNMLEEGSGSKQVEWQRDTKEVAKVAE